MNDPLIPNCVATPNILFDVWMSLLSGAEFKVTMYLARRTYGFHKGPEGDTVSLPQFMNGIRTRAGKVLDNGTGLSREAVRTALDVLCDIGLVQRERQQSDNGGDAPSHYVLCFGATPPSIEELVFIRKKYAKAPAAKGVKAAESANQNADLTGANNLTGGAKNLPPPTENLPPPETGNLAGGGANNLPPGGEDFPSESLERGGRFLAPQNTVLHELQNLSNNTPPPNPQMGEGLTPQNERAGGQGSNLSKEPEAEAEPEAPVNTAAHATTRPRKPKAKPSERQRELLRAFNETKHENGDPEPTETEAHKYAPLLAKAISDGYTPATVRYATQYVLLFVATGKWSSDEYVTPNSAIQRIPELVRRGAITNAGEVLIPVECLHEPRPGLPRPGLAPLDAPRPNKSRRPTEQEAQDELDASYHELMTEGLTL